jgi:pimeloyl-ACP methyl ester carboxylesterase
VVNVLLSAQTRAQAPAAVELVADCLARFDRSALRNAVVSVSLRRSDLSGVLRSLTVPTLIVTGSDHQGWTPQHADAAAALLRDGSVAVVAGAAYLAPLEAPAETAELVRTFWTTTVPGRRPGS